MSKTYKPTHVQKMRAGYAYKTAARGEVTPIRRGISRGERRS